VGGTIIRLASQGHGVHVLDMTNGEPTPHGSVEARARESAEAAKIMGVQRSLLGSMHSGPVRRPRSSKPTPRCRPSCPAERDPPARRNAMTDEELRLAPLRSREEKWSPLRRRHFSAFSRTRVCRERSTGFSH
jgi:LmbE family N-acetylglucosaminyl deacetylase